MPGNESIDLPTHHRRETVIPATVHPDGSPSPGSPVGNLFLSPALDMFSTKIHQVLHLPQAHQERSVSIDEQVLRHADPWQDKVAR